MVWDEQRVKQLRQKLGLSQAELALELGCRQQTVSEWELGLYAPANAYGKLLSQLELRVGIASASTSAASSAFDFDPDAESIDKAFDPAID